MKKEMIRQEWCIEIIFEEYLFEFSALIYIWKKVTIVWRGKILG